MRDPADRIIGGNNEYQKKDLLIIIISY